MGIHDGVFFCDKCGETIPTDTARGAPGGEILCPACYRKAAQKRSWPLWAKLALMAGIVAVTTAIGGIGAGAQGAIGGLASGIIMALVGWAGLVLNDRAERRWKDGPAKTDSPPAMSAPPARPSGGWAVGLGWAAMLVAIIMASVQWGYRWHTMDRFRNDNAIGATANALESLLGRVPDLAEKIPAVTIACTVALALLLTAIWRELVLLRRRAASK